MDSRKGLVRTILAVVIATLLTSGCMTIQRQEMTYLGDDSVSIANVTGKVRHVDWGGVDVDADQYAHEYNEAILDAMNRAPEGTQTLTSIKAFKEQKSWPLVVGAATMFAGATLVYYGFDYYGGWALVTGGLVYLVGAAITPINIYDFYVIAEPSGQQ